MGFIVYFVIGIVLAFAYIFLRRCYEKYNKPDFMHAFSHYCEIEDGLMCGVLIIIWPLLIFGGVVAAGFCGVIILFMWLGELFTKICNKIIK